MMQKELLDWRNQYRQLSNQLEREQKYVRKYAQAFKFKVNNSNNS